MVTINESSDEEGDTPEKCDGSARPTNDDIADALRRVVRIQHVSKRAEMSIRTVRHEVEKSLSLDKGILKSDPTLRELSKNVIEAEHVSYRILPIGAMFEIWYISLSPKLFNILDDVRFI